MEVTLLCLEEEEDIMLLELVTKPKKLFLFANIVVVKSKRKRMYANQVDLGQEVRGTNNRNYAITGTDTGATHHITSSLDSLDKANVSPAHTANKVHLPNESTVKYSVKSVSSVNSVKKFESIDVWHRRLGHASVDVIKKHDGVRTLTSKDVFHCPVCPLAKHTKLPFTQRNHVSKHNMFSTNVKTLRTHNGGEFFNTAVQSLLTLVIEFSSQDFDYGPCSSKPPSPASDLPVHNVSLPTEVVPEVFDVLPSTQSNVVVPVRRSTRLVDHLFGCRIL
uniref:GAG-pre-integrase domain-containing protein n=1 Tax=Solanum lycopersicum TaxID=4081 RepID=A0A3Q7GN26_SOLLC